LIKYKVYGVGIKTITINLIPLTPKNMACYKFNP
jgi:hypothetical protein